ncbi:MAG: hypothetical protein IJI25_05290 [Eubacterium sp.]|nr:hypothetical protein [Eubacterium sp.]
MKNNEKIDINLEGDSSVNDEELTEEQRCQEYYETGLRYINIANYMKKYEDQDKYYHKALVNLKKAREKIPGLNPLIRETDHKKFYARANGKITLYKEACQLRDNAQTPTDYLTAQTLFDRIHKHELTHIVYENHVTPELYEEVNKCSDSEQQSEYCGEMATKLMKKQRRKSVISSGIFLLFVIMLLAFSRTTTSRLCLGEFCKITHHYGRAYQFFYNVYQKTNDPSVLEKYEEARYLAALEGYKTRNREDVRDSFRELARLNYKDSEDYLVKMEKARIKELPDGEKIRFGEVNWRILTHDGDKVLLLKDKTQGEAPFHTGGGAANWETSTIRAWLNKSYMNELFSFDKEKDAIIETALPVSDNPVYGTKGGNGTTDKLFLLSSEEFLKYSEFLPTTHYLWWLRTPGSTPETVSIVSTDKEVMDFGYDAGSDIVKARPAIWVDVSE